MSIWKLLRHTHDHPNGATVSKVKVAAAKHLTDTVDFHGESVMELSISAVSQLSQPLQYRDKPYSQA